MTSVIGRRQMVRLASGLVAVGGIAPLIAPSLAIAGEKAKQEEKMEDVTPPEDLMREHGVLNRLLLIYEAAMQKFAANESFDPSILSKSAQIIRDFIENYHEINEENHLFPRFRKAGKLVQLVDVLFQQHLAGRRVTETILRLAPASAAPGEDARKQSRPCRPSSGCTGRTKPERTRSCFRRLEASYPPTSLTPWAKTSRRMSSGNSARTASKRP